MVVTFNHLSNNPTGTLTVNPPVDPADSLAVVTGIPAGVQHDHPVRPHQVDAQRAGLGRHEEEGHVAVRVERVDQPLALLRRRRAVQPEVGAAVLPPGVRACNKSGVRLAYCIH